MTDPFFGEAQGLLDAGRPFATATVVRIERPTSGKPGDRAIVTLDGRLSGWIGGSCAEPTVVEEALRAIADNRSRLIRLSPNPGAAPVPEGVSEVALTCFSGGTLDIFIQPHQPQPRLLVVGSSPVTRALVSLGRAMDYRVIALDPDAAGEVAGAHETLRDVTALAGSVTPLTFVVVSTHGNYDEPAVAAALRTHAPYVGLVASHTRGEAVRAALRAEGVGEEALARLSLPAGLDIGARRGDEIALSILAELIQVRRSMERVEWEAEVGSDRAPAASPAAPAVAAPDDGAPAGEEPAVEAVAIDPVCGMSVRIEGAKNTFEHDGRTWYFCCGGCRGRFAAQPEAYLGGVGGG